MKKQRTLNQILAQLRSSKPENFELKLIEKIKGAYDLEKPIKKLCQIFQTEADNARLNYSKIRKEPFDYDETRLKSEEESLSKSDERLSKLNEIYFDFVGYSHASYLQYQVISNSIRDEISLIKMNALMGE